jgi:hypothetical protein
MARISHPALHHTNHHQNDANNCALKITRIFHCSSFSIVFGYGEWTPWIGKDISLCPQVWISSGSIPCPIPFLSVSIFQGVIWTEDRVDHSPSNRSMLIKGFTAFPLGNFIVHAMKACRGREGISPLIRHLDSRENPWYPSNRKLCGPRSRVWRFWREVSLLLGIERRMVRPLA